MPIEGSSTREKVVTPEHLHAFRRSLQAIDSEGSFEVHGSSIDDLIERSGDTYLWHREPGAAYAESDILRARVDQSGINSQARLAHGALGLMYALESAYLQSGDTPIRGITDIRFVAPVFEGAKLRAHVEEMVDGAATFEIMSDSLTPAGRQIESGLAITGRILYGAIGDSFNAAAFGNLGEQQLFSLEEAIGLLSALIGLWVQGEGGRVLYMGQELTIGGLVEVWDRLEAEGAIIGSQPGRRVGWRTTTRVTVSAKRSEMDEAVPGETGPAERQVTVPVAAGESIFLYLEHPPAI